jgi:hypothetical protein
VNNLDGHKGKKPTKKQMIEEVIPNQFKEELRNAHIKGMVQGFEVANQMLLEYADSHTIEELRDFCKKNIEQKQVMEKVVSGNVD